MISRSCRGPIDRDRGIHDFWTHIGVAGQAGEGHSRAPCALQRTTEHFASVHSSVSTPRFQSSTEKVGDGFQCLKRELFAFQSTTSAHADFPRSPFLDGEGAASKSIDNRSLALLGSQRIHGRDGCCTARGNHGGKEGANGQPAGGHNKGERIPTGNTVQFRRDQTPRADGERQP